MNPSHGEVAPLGLVAKGCILALLVGTPVGFVIGVQAIPVDYLNIANVLQLSPWKRLTRILIPAALPYMLTGFRLSLGIAGLVIVALEMLG
jgi:nitrate/nitrite transport system permease protein